MSTYALALCNGLLVKSPTYACTYVRTCIRFCLLVIWMSIKNACINGNEQTQFHELMLFFLFANITCVFAFVKGLN